MSSWSDEVRLALSRLSADCLQWVSDRAALWGAIGPHSTRARRFLAFGDGSAICFPSAALFGEAHIHLGAATIVGPHVSLSAGVAPDHDLSAAPPGRELASRTGVREVVRIGDRCVIGRGSGIVGHEHIVIGDDVYTGHYVYITDANHGYEDLTIPIGHQLAAPRPVHIGDGSWIGHGAIVLPGASIGRHAVIGAGSVVTGAVPDYSVAVGNPARVIRRLDPGRPDPGQPDPGQGVTTARNDSSA